MHRHYLRPERGALCKTTPLFVVLVMAAWALAEVSIPDTPAGQTLKAFFAAFNSSDHDRIAAYVKETIRQITWMA